MIITSDQPIKYTCIKYTCISLNICNVAHVADVTHVAHVADVAICCFVVIMQYRFE